MLHCRERHLRLGLELALGRRDVGSLTRDPCSWRYQFQSFLSVACEGPISDTRAGWQARCPSDPSILQKWFSTTELSTPSHPLSGGLILTSSEHHGRSREFDAQAVRFVVFIPILINSTLYPYRYHVEYNERVHCCNDDQDQCPDFWSVPYKA